MDEIQLQEEPQWLRETSSSDKSSLLSLIAAEMSKLRPLSAKARTNIQMKSGYKFQSWQISEAAAWLSTQEAMDVDDEPQTQEVTVYACDIRDRDDPNMVVEYIDELYQYYKECENVRAPGQYMDQQEDITARMRAILIDWLVEVHLKFKLAPSTLYLCVHLIDQYCTHNQVQRSKLQLVGITALLIACKYEEIYPPEVRDCVYITDHAYTREEVLEMETMMLNHFEYNITVPTGYQFLIRFLRIANVEQDTKTWHRASYFSERCLQEHDMLSYKPSMVVAASAWLAMKYERMADPWPASLVEYSGYTVEDMTACAKQIIEHVSKSPNTSTQKRPLKAVRSKFETYKYSGVSEDAPPTL